MDNQIQILQGTAILTFRACGRVLPVKFIWLSLVDDFQAFLSHIHLNLMRYAQFLCLRLINYEEHRNILAWNKQHWFPILHTNEMYWHDLSSQSIFSDMQTKELVHQMRSLLSMLLHIFTNQLISWLTDQGQVSVKFLSLQNLILICEAFQVLINLLNSFETLNWTKLDWDLSLSQLFREFSIIDHQII